MSFYSDPSFFFLLAAVVAGAVVLGLLERPLGRYGLVVSLAMLVCLFSDDWSGLVLALASVALGYVATRLVLARCSSERGLTAPVRLLGLAAAIGPLVVYKVTTAAAAPLGGFIGISYMTFKITQVLLEVEDGLITDLPFLDYVGFLVFFPVFTSGPIDRSRRFMADAHKARPRAEYLDLLGRGIVQLLVGAAMQMVLATLARQYYQPAAIDLTKDLGPQLQTAFVTAWAYAGFLYFDFAGYSLMAQGASRALGIDTPANFRLPFLSCSMEEFWDRWHITLSHWLRDYVFMRLERSLTRHRIPRKRDTRAAVGLIADMCLMGAWHGIAPQYLLYGLYHGLLLAGETLMRRRWHFYKVHHADLPVRVVCWFVTINLVVIGFTLFSGQAFTFLGGIHG
ncbi:MAG: D-alanyl-lipoteichoic acid biosynthesis protein DltB [Atopobiaceae bacterium]|jgi:membrane protein involved in D-alanine export|nr:D-alanyl-lipoteichoic acid biosynthesis protein DltB [Atopobiaceae bacterium]MCH4180131.1 D-alanyl-lipoteichoic acid biosynthesis protein DltB [Atopobiaceae bacterium]MCH4213817.1 D-alanyl-lipoteichoic acid biosynthesis protein DltB [Atopobiaceae bacterium]MCH4229919.1 D-alanyl-lipoteichoic acid biosynthesis protein DltB [Atopobiaceae bacterium]MCH4275720.1 D-alanyl-lipoteichoic acid biosynthesis protein DltB [Atopobiaceae bacterium]